MELSIEDLARNLERHLASVAAGRTLTITDDGRPVARIVPIGQPTRLETLIAAGRVTRASHPKRPAPDPLPATGTASELIHDQRR
jgi:prevent-host-death family protein